MSNKRYTFGKNSGAKANFITKVPFVNSTKNLPALLGAIAIALAFFVSGCATIPETAQVKLSKSPVSGGEPYCLTLKYDYDAVPGTTVKVTRHSLYLLSIDGEKINTLLQERSTKKNFAPFELLIPPGEHSLKFGWSGSWRDDFYVGLNGANTMKFNGLPGKKYEIQIHCEIFGKLRFNVEKTPSRILWKLIELDTGRVIDQSTP